MSEAWPTVVQLHVMRTTYNVAINRDLVYNQACILSHDIHVVSYCFDNFYFMPCCNNYFQTEDPFSDRNLTITCEDPEYFVKGGLTLTTFF